MRIFEHYEKPYDFEELIVHNFRRFMMMRIIFGGVMLMIATIYLVIHLIVTGFTAILWVLIPVVALIFIVFTGIIISNRIRIIKGKKDYYRTTYYEETQKPFDIKFLIPQNRYKLEVYDAIRRKISPRHPMLFEVTPTWVDASKMDPTIDLILFHTSGIYVIEAECYDGPLVGELDQPTWTPYAYIGSKKQIEQKLTRVIDQTIDVIWKKRNYMSNPFMRLDIHLDNLNNIAPFDYQKVVIFADQMFDPSIKRQNDMGIYQLDQFVNEVQDNKEFYTPSEIQRIHKLIISKMNRFDESE